MRSLCVAVPAREAEGIRRALHKQGLLRTGISIVREGGTVFLPTASRVDTPYPVSEREFRESFAPIRSYRDVANVPAEVKPDLPTSFDIVGDIAIIRISEDLREHETAIAEAILRTNARVRVVAADGGVKGPLRIRDLRILAGPDRTETVHREYGLAYRVDVAKAYFSPRLASERNRVAQQVQPGEVVLDVFSGVGPHAILIARRRAPAVVHAFDANPDAFRYLEDNVRRNRADRVRPRLGDGIGLVAAVDRPNRIILDYPSDPDPAFRAALFRLLPGGTVHYYAILNAAEREERERDLADAAGSVGRSAEILAVREVHGWSPAQKLFAFDVGVT